MSFFYAKAQSKNVSRDPISKGTLHKLECRGCPLDKADVCTPKMQPSGTDQPDIYVLGEAPGRQEDEKGEPLVGPSGQILKEALASAIVGEDCEGVRMDSLNEVVKETVRFNNVIRTRPPENRDPQWQEIEACRPSVERDIEASKPRLIIGVGNIALKWIIGEERITAWRGRQIPVKIGQHECWFMPVMHPSAVLRQRKKSASGKVLKSHLEHTLVEDLRYAINNVRMLPEPHVEDLSKINDGVRYFTGDGSTDLKKIKRWLDELSEQPTLSLDIETNHVRPYGKHSKLLTIAVGDDRQILAFPLWHPQSRFTTQQTRELEGIFKDFMLNYEGSLVAHNLAFEMEWLTYFFGNEIACDVSWEDTMAQAYVLDTRKGVLNLDSLCLIHMGFRLKDVSEISTANLEKEKLESVLNYNALDVKYEHKLYQSQVPQIENQGLREVYKEQLRRIPTIILTQLKGLDVDQGNVTKHKNNLADRIAQIERELSSVKAVKKYEQDQRVNFNPSSPQQCMVILRDYLKRPEGDRGNGKYSTADDVLAQIEEPFAKLLHEHRTLSKLKTTFVDTLATKGKYLWPDGKLHPNFNTMFTSTRRLSSSEPNAQNFPKRDHREVREQIKPPEGYYFLSCDYGQLEARVIAMASGDAYLVKALWERYDIHQEWAERIAHEYPERIGGKKFINDKDVMKKLRNDVKNQFVFPLFYGSWAGSITNDLGVPFEQCKKLEKQFWQTFSGTKEWQEKLERDYNSCGHVESLTGFRYRAPLKRNEIINYPIQGTASDLVVDAMNRLSEMARKTGNWQFQPVIQIHDDLGFFVPEETLDDDVEKIITYMLDVPYKWVITPVAVEAEIGKDWANQDEVGTFESDEFL